MDVGSIILTESNTFSLIDFGPPWEGYYLKILRSEELHVVTRGSKSSKPLLNHTGTSTRRQLFSLQNIHDSTIVNEHDLFRPQM